MMDALTLAHAHPDTQGHALTVRLREDLATGGPRTWILGGAIAVGVVIAGVIAIQAAPDPRLLLPDPTSQIESAGAVHPDAPRHVLRTDRLPATVSTGAVHPGAPRQVLRTAGQR